MRVTLDEAIARTPAMDSEDLGALLELHTPLTGGQINSLIHGEQLPSATLTRLLLSSNLSNGNLNQVVKAEGYFTDAEVRDILIANSPLNTDVTSQLSKRTTPLNMSDYMQVMSAQ